MTEIPEHLLKRSKERRSAIGGGDDASEEASAPAAAAPAAAVEAAPAAAAAPAAPEPKPAPKPDRPEVAAYKARRKIPFWAMPVLAGLPLWAYVYQATLEPAPAANDTPLALGEAVYTSEACAACHGASGGGVSGPALTDVMGTWPDYRDHMVWVRLGSTGWPTNVYGATDKAKGGGMPSHDFSDAELAEVVLYERVAFGGLDPLSEEALELEAISHGELTLEEAGLGPVAERDGVDPAVLAEP